jgi:hypothetical protein
MTKPLYLSPWYVPWHKLISYVKIWRVNLYLTTQERPANEAVREDGRKD